MIDEDVLRDLLAEAAAAAPAPGRAPESLVEELVASPPTAHRWRPPPQLLVGAAALVAVVVALGLLRAAPDQRASLDSSSSSGGDVSATTIAPPMATGGATAGGSAASGGGAGGVGATGGAPAPPVTQPARIVKTGSLDIEVDTRAFGSTVERVTSIAVGLGGYVAESSASEADGVPSGSITVRVPAGSFEQLVAGVRALGEVRSVTTKGTDVTAQFTDLDARLRALTATRDRLYEVLRGARAVGDIIAVQDRITGVQTEIEQLQGQQRLLTDQAGFGTLAVTLAEPGAARAAAVSRDEGLRHAFAVARHRFADSVEGFIAWLGSAALPLVLVAGLALLARFVWLRERRRLL
jgi:hypothetical protein